MAPRRFNWRVALIADVNVQQAPQIIETVAPVMAAPIVETFAPAPIIGYVGKAAKAGQGGAP